MPEPGCWSEAIDKAKGPRSVGYGDQRKADEISECRRIELTRLFLTTRRSVTIRYRTRASQRRRSARKKERQSGNSAGRFGESSKTSLSFVSSAFLIGSAFEILDLHLGGLDDPT